MRRAAALATALAAAAVAFSAGTSGAARGVTFTDPAGDANGLDGRTAVGSQPGLDVVRVTLTPDGRGTKKSGIAVRIDLSGPVPAVPGTSYYFSAVQDGCDLRVDLAWAAQGWDWKYSRRCSSGLGSGGYSSGTITALAAPTGTSVTFSVPADALPDSRIGARLSNIYVGSAVTDPVLHQLGVHPDSATYNGTYAVGS